MVCFVSPQVWFKNRRAKFRKKQRSLQKEQLQKQKEAPGEGGSEKEDAPPSTTIVPDGQLPPSASSSPLEAEGSVVRPVPLDMDLNVTSAEHSGSESATEDNTDREEESKCQAEELKCERAATPEDVSPVCKRLSPKAGQNRSYMTFSTSAPSSVPISIVSNSTFVSLIQTLPWSLHL